MSGWSLGARKRSSSRLQSSTVTPGTGTTRTMGGSPRQLQCSMRTIPPAEACAFWVSDRKVDCFGMGSHWGRCRDRLQDLCRDHLRDQCTDLHRDPCTRHLLARCVHRRLDLYRGRLQDLWVETTSGTSVQTSTGTRVRATSWPGVCTAAWTCIEAASRTCILISRPGLGGGSGSDSENGSDYRCADDDFHFPPLTI